MIKTKSFTVNISIFCVRFKRVKYKLIQLITKNMSREKNILERDEKTISEAMKIRFFPMVMKSQEGAIIQDLNDNKLIDFTSAWAVANTGYRHPTVIQKLKEQLNVSIANSPISVSEENIVTLAERLIDLTGFDFPTKVWFGHSGSEAGDLISKTLTAKGDGDTIINFKGSYHGITTGAAMISGHSAQEGISGENTVSLDFPNLYRSELSKEELKERHLEQAKEAFENDDVAGLITEPLQSDGGILVPPDGFLKGLGDLCEDHNAYYVIDEVKAGLGRTGETFAHQHDEAEPDAIMLGKPLGSGIPISAVVGRKELVDFEPASHMMTTAGGPMSVAAAHATLDVLEEEDLAAQAKKKGKYLSKLLNGIKENNEHIGDVRGKGMMQGVELLNSEGKFSQKFAAKTCYRARELGLLVFYVGLDSNVLEITPPIIISKDELKKGCEILEKTINDVAAGKVTDKDIERYAGW